MSAPVAGGGVAKGALAVLRDAAHVLDPLDVLADAPNRALGRKLDVAREAFAELIAAAKESELVLAEKLRRLGADPNASTTIHKLRAALSNIEGGKA